MDFRILGQLQVVDGGRDVEVRGARQRAVLAVLLVNANRVVSADRLIDDVWGDRPPASGAAALQMRVSQLRRALITVRSPAQADQGPLLTVPGGYVLRVGADDVDALRFERLLAQGRALAADGDHAGASMRLRTARALWRGDTLSEFAFEPFAQTEIARLGELRLVAAEECFEAELALGQHAVLVPEVEALVGAHPLRERLRAILMIALYRSARQADALATYREARAYLLRELGVEPGSTLQRLENQVLRHAADLELQTPRDVMAVRPVTTPGEPSRKPITVVCTSVRVTADRSSESWTVLDPERRSAALARCLAVQVQVFEQHGALVRRLPGAVLAVFGLPIVREDDALRAVRATVGAHEQVEALAGVLTHDDALRVQARSGIVTGDVLTRGGAPDELWESGEPAGTALELSTRADPGEVLIADSTEPLIRHAAALTRRATSPDSGAWCLGSLAAVHGIHAVRRDAPMVGRQSELATLASTLERAAATRAVHTCTVVGARGCGEVPAGAGVRRGCPGHGDRGDRGVRAVRRDRDVLAPPPGRRAGGRRPATREVMLGTEHADLVTRLVASAVGMGRQRTPATCSGRSAASSRPEPGPAARRGARRRALGVTHDARTGRVPVRLATACGGSAGLPWTVPICSRGVPVGCTSRASTRIELVSPGPGRDRRSCSGTWLAPSICATDVRRRLARVRRGSPLFLEQLLTMLTGAPGTSMSTRTSHRRSRPCLPLGCDLRAGERAVLERAAVVGRAFHRDAVAALLPSSARSTVDRHLAALATRDLLTAHESHDAAATHLFRHGLIHAAASQRSDGCACRAARDARWVARGH